MSALDTAVGEQMSIAIDAVYDDLMAQQAWDREHKLTEASAAVLAWRWEKLREAIQQAGERDECGWTPYPVRQAALDLASSLTMLAGRLPRPTIPAKQERGDE